MRNNPNDLSNQLLTKIKKCLESELSDFEEYGDVIGSVDSFDHGIVAGRAEYSESLLNKIKEWEEECRT